MKKVIITIVFALGILQLIRPSKNIGPVDSAKSIEAKVAMPADVKASLQKACYDCHSNNTVYPWYAEVQPVGWYLTNHVRDGKRHLNFDEFMNLKPKQQDHKMKELVESQEEGWMPIDSYTWIHKNAILTQDEKKAIINYANSVRAAVGYKQETNEEEKREHENRD